MIFHQPKNSFGNFHYDANIFKNISFSPHFHGNYELVYSMQGRTEIWVNGMYEALDEGELLLIPPYTVHSLRIEGVKTWIGVFSDDYVTAFSHSNRYARYGKFRCREEIEGFLQNNLFFMGQPDRFLHIACLYLVCNECIQNGAKLSTNQDQRFIQKVTSYISENARQKLDMQAVADDLNYEYHYFSSLFHRCFGMNFKNFINMFRFNQACRLLADRSVDMNDICERCGFGSIRNFNRVFKNFSGITPSEYRKNQDKQQNA